MRWLLTFLLLIPMGYPFNALSNISTVEQDNLDVLDSGRTLKDTLSIVKKLGLAEEKLKSGAIGDALGLAVSTLDGSSVIYWKKGMAQSHDLLGRIGLLNKEESIALEHFLRASYYYGDSKEYLGRVRIFDYIGKIYISMGHHALALDNLKKGLDLANEHVSAQTGVFRLAIADCYLINGLPEIAVPYLHEIDTKLIKKAEVADRLCRAYTDMGKLDSALIYAEIEKDWLLKEQDTKLSKLLESYNRSGYLLRQLGQLKQSLDTLESALSIIDWNDHKKGVELLSNLATTYQVLGEHREARKHLQEAISITEERRDLSRSATLYNLLAASYLIEKKDITARSNVETAVEMARITDNVRAEADALIILERLAVIEGNIASSLSFKKESEILFRELTEKQAEVKTENAIEEEMARENELRTIGELEKEEQRFNDLERLKEETIRKGMELELERNRATLLEQDRQMQEQILMAERLERERVRQELNLSEERLTVLEKQSELDRLHAENENRSLMERNRSETMELLKKNNAMQADQIKTERTNRIFLITAIVVLIVLIIIITYLLFLRNKKNKELEVQKSEIQEKNEELRESGELLQQNMYMLERAKELVAKQKEMLQLTGDFAVWEQDFGEGGFYGNNIFYRIYDLNEDMDRTGDIFITIRDLVYEEDRSGFSQSWEACSKGKEITGYQYRIENTKGLRYINSSMRPIIEKNKVVGILGVSMDITEIKENEKNLVEQNDMLQKLNKELDQFVYRTSHNLRAPLTSIMGLIGLIEQDDDKETQKGYLGLITTSITKLDETIKEINNYSKNARISIDLEELDLEEVVLETYESLMYMRRNAEECNLYLDIPEGFKLVSDRSRLEIIFNNILSNAIKYIHPLNKKCEISVWCRKLEEGIVINVSDKGMGIAEDYQERIFEMFFRAVDSSSIPGSGLGLYIVKEAVDKLNGKISLDSELGIGSKFTITLPVLGINQENV